MKNPMEFDENEDDGKNVSANMTEVDDRFDSV